jgi:hypothetical protein
MPDTSPANLFWREIGFFHPNIHSKGGYKVTTFVLRHNVIPGFIAVDGSDVTSSRSA